MKPQQLSISFIRELKQQILASRYAVAKIANAEMLHLYFSVGKMVDDEFSVNKWGAKVNDEIASRLQQELPGLRGFSGSNIRKMRIFYQEWISSKTICPTLSDKTENVDNEILPTLSDKLALSKLNDENTIWSSETSKTGNANVSTFLSIPFSHHYEIILKTDTEEDRWYYINKKVEYSFRDFSKPLGVATYRTSETLPPELKDTLPDAETLKSLME